MFEVSWLFGPNGQCYGKNRCIVCDNVPILCMHVHPGMANNVAGESFPCRRTEKPFSIFRAQKTGRFVNQPPNESFEMPAPHFSKMIDHLTFTNVPTGVSKTFRSTPGEKDKCLPNRHELGPI